MVSSQNWGRGDPTSSPGHDMDPELAEKRKKQAHNARELQVQMQQNRELREREKQNERRREEKEEADLLNYNPFGRGGAGAPLRNEYGDVQANLREVTREAPNPNGTRYDGPSPAINDLLERTRPGMGGPPPSYMPMPSGGAARGGDLKGAQHMGGMGLQQLDKIGNGNSNRHKCEPGYPQGE